jgi:diguanylate cyclase
LLLQRGVRDKRDAEQRCTSLLAALCKPATIGSEVVDVRSSLGMSLFPADGQNIHELLSVADAALYAVKRGRTPLEQVPTADRRLRRSG